MFVIINTDTGPDSEPDSENEEMAVVPDKFDGHIDDRDWLEDFTAYTTVKRLDDNQAASMARFLFAGDGRTWYKTLPVDIRASFRALSAAFEAYWLHGPKKPNLSLKQRLASNATQKPGQSVPDFVHEVMSLAQGLDMSDAMILRIVESGLKPELLPFYRQANPQTPHDVIRCEALQVATATTSSPNEGLLDAIDNLLSAKIKALAPVGLSLLAQAHKDNVFARDRAEGFDRALQEKLGGTPSTPAPEKISKNTICSDLELQVLNSVSAGDLTMYLESELAVFLESPTQGGFMGLIFSDGTPTFLKGEPQRLPPS